jgi:hypothetical protein
MKMADILHSIADMLDQQEGEDNTAPGAIDFQHDVDHSGQDAGCGTELDPNPVMIPPLQWTMTS